MRAKTDSFIAEVPLRTSAADERELSIRLDAARQIYNAVLGECLRVLGLMRESKDWQRARAIPKGAERNAAFRAVRERFDFKSSMADRFAIRCKNGCWIGDHLSSNETQKTALRAFSAVEQHALGARGRPHFKRVGELDSVEGKTNTCGIRFKDGFVEWSGLRLELMLDPRDPKAWQAEALERKTKFCRLLRRRVRGTSRWYVQLVQTGTSPLVPTTTAGAVVGLDLGPSTIAAVSEQDATLEQFCPGVEQPWRELRRLERAMDRSRRATNPEHFDAEGRAKKGKKKWKRSRRYRKLAEKRRERDRRLAAERKRSHGELANRVVAQGDTIKTEKLSYFGFQRAFGRSSKVRGAGLFVATVRRKVEAVGGQLVEFSTYKTRLSQLDLPTGTYAKKPLSQRVHVLGDGTGELQRDLYSAFLARFVVAENAMPARSAAVAFPAAKPLLRRAASSAAQPASGGGFPLPQALRRLRAGRPSKRDEGGREAGDVVAARRGPRRATAKMLVARHLHLSEPPGFIPGEV